MKFERVAYRKWFRPGKGQQYLVITKAGRQVMKLMGDAMKRGHAVEFTQHPPIDGGTDISGRKNTHSSGVYDQISLTITETP